MLLVSPWFISVAFILCYRGSLPLPSSFCMDLALPLLPCLHWAMLSEIDRFLCLQNMDAPQNSPVEFFLSLVSHTLRSESHQHFLAVSQMVQRLQDQRWSTWWVIRSKYPIIKAIVPWISFYWQFKTSLIAYERNWQLMLTTEAELVPDTKIDKDGRDVRFQQQGQHRKKNKRDIWSVCRSQTLSVRPESKL